MRDSVFVPTFTPEQILELGVFDGCYFNEDDSCIRVNGELPYIRQKNLFASNVSQSRQLWIDNGWITKEDPLGWFQWYVRYYNGRRIEKLDAWQIKRWKSFVSRHSAQVKKNGHGDLTKRVRQRQCLLHWASDPIPDINANDKFSFLQTLI
jgi:hypothetical protein